MKIYITNNTDTAVSREIRGVIKSAVNESAKEIMPGKSFEVSVMLVNNEEIHALNFQHRNMDKPTDVLSFPMIEDFAEEYENILGDIVISMEQAKIQAENYEHSFEREIGFLAVHSMLHLFGYDHETPEDEAEMFAVQEKILDKMGLTR
ncbi:MAG: rRNA maturation RNase YbeY [Oscillospiraceae bacterium]|nr:rRNA maturation RNase YbeY [Oscillospiraceae bacterium]